MVSVHCSHSQLKLLETYSSMPLELGSNDVDGALAVLLVVIELNRLGGTQWNFDGILARLEPLLPRLRQSCLLGLFVCFLTRRHDERKKKLR